MSDHISNIFQDVRRHALSESERVSMRNTLLAHMAEHPAVAPMRVRFADALGSLGDAFGSQEVSNMRFVPATLAMVFVVGLGTAYAAEGALPGQPLYAVKVNINESVKGALALSDVAEASWHTEKIERRLSEAEALVAAGALTPDAQSEIETGIRTAVAAFDKNVEKLAETKGDAAVAAAQSDLEASLIGHAEVLVALAASPDAEVNAEPIIRSVLSRAEAVQAARFASEASVVARGDGKQIREAALKNKTKAKEAVNSVRAKASSALVEASTTAEVARTTTEEAEGSITRAEENLREGDYGSAFSHFQEAIRAIKTVEVHIDASERLNTDVKVFTRSRSDEGAAATMMMSVEPAEGNLAE